MTQAQSYEVSGDTCDLTAAEERAICSEASAAGMRGGTVPWPTQKEITKFNATTSPADNMKAFRRSGSKNRNWYNIQAATPFPELPASVPNPSLRNSGDAVSAQMPVASCAAPNSDPMMLLELAASVAASPYTTATFDATPTDPPAKMRRHRTNGAESVLDSRGSVRAVSCVYMTEQPREWANTCLIGRCFQSSNRIQVEEAEQCVADGTDSEIWTNVNPPTPASIRCRCGLYSGSTVAASGQGVPDSAPSAAAACDAAPFSHSEWRTPKSSRSPFRLAFKLQCALQTTLKNEREGVERPRRCLRDPSQEKTLSRLPLAAAQGP